MGNISRRVIVKVVHHPLGYVMSMLVIVGMKGATWASTSLVNSSSSLGKSMSCIWSINVSYTVVIVAIISLSCLC